MKKIILATAVAVCTSLPAYAETVVDWLHTQNVTSTVELMEAAAREYEALNSDVKINVQFIGGEAYKAKLITLLQTDAAPDIFYSWGGGVMTDQQKAGVLRTINDVVSDSTIEGIGSGGINAFTRDGGLYGLAQNVSMVGLWTNDELLEKAGVTDEDFKTWSGFLGGVKKLKDAGITPISVGAQEKWPAHFYWSYLVMRVAGQDAFNSARLGEGDGFAGAPFVKAGELFLDLVELEPFQPGFLAADYGNAAGYFGDGKAAIHLMGDWDYTSAKANSTSEKGIDDDKLSYRKFPVVAGGAGDASDTLGGINGWLFHKDASDESVKFMEWFLSADVQKRFAEAAIYVPIVAGSSEALSNQFLQVTAESVSSSQWHAIFFDQELGKDVGGVVNDISVELADNAISAEDAAELVKEAIDDSL